MSSVAEIRFQFALKDTKALARHAGKVADKAEQVKRSSSVPPR